MQYIIFSRKNNAAQILLLRKSISVHTIDEGLIEYRQNNVCLFQNVRGN